MTAMRQNIEGWLEEAKEMGASHVVVVHDTFDHDNFPLLKEHRAHHWVKWPSLGTDKRKQS